MQPRPLDRAESKTGRLHAPTHGDANAERGVLRSAEAKEADEVSTSRRAAGARGPEDENGGSDSVDDVGGKESGSPSGRRTLAMRRDVEERVAFFKGMVRECDEEVCACFSR